MSADTDIPESGGPFVLDEGAESIEYEEFLRSLLSLTMITKSLEAFGNLVDTVKKIEQSPGQTIQTQLPSHVGSKPMAISSELKALETLTYFNICAKYPINRDECAYTLTDPVGKNFALCLGGTLHQIGREHHGPRMLQEEAMHRGVNPAQYVHHLIRTKALSYAPPDATDFKKDVQHANVDLRDTLDLVRAELTFYLMDDTDRDSWN